MSKRFKAGAHDKEQELQGAPTAGSVVTVFTAMKRIVNMPVRCIVVHQVLFIVQLMVEFSTEEKPVMFMDRICEGTKGTVFFVPARSPFPLLAIRMRTALLS